MHLQDRFSQCFLPSGTTTRLFLALPLRPVDIFTYFHIFSKSWAGRRPALSNQHPTFFSINYLNNSFYNSTLSDIKVGIGTCAYENPETHTGIGFNISSGGMRDGGSFTVYGIAYS